MNATIIPLQGDEHQQVQLLLPWYVTGRLEALEHARVEAHLAGCAECQADVAHERKLAAEVRGLSVSAESGWSRLRERIAAAEPAPGPARRSFQRPPAWLGWALAAQFIFALALGALLLPRSQPARYQTLGARPAEASAPAVVTGDLVVIFRPDTREQDLRATINGVGGRVVDGPTSTDAYVLQVPAPRRDAALAALRGSAAVLLAEPLGAAGAP